MSRCWACGVSVDLLRAPAVGVVGRQIVPYCSRACRNGEARAAERADAVEPSLAVAPVVIYLEAGEPTPLPLPAMAGPPGDDLSDRTPLPQVVPVAAPRAAAWPARVGRALALGAAVASLTAALEWAVPTRASTAAGSTMAASLIRQTAPAIVAPPAPPGVDPAVLREQARALLDHALDDARSQVRLRAAAALAGRSARADALLRARLTEVSWAARAQAAIALATAGDVEGRAALHQSLSAPFRDARTEAAVALARLGDPAGEGLLLEVLAGNPRSRLGAADALARLGQKGAIEWLRSALASPSEEVRLRAAVALGAVGDDAARSVLEEAVARDPLRLDAAAALLRLGDRAAAVQAAVRCLAASSLREEAAAALAAARVAPPTDALAGLGRAMELEDEPGRVTAAHALLLLLGDAPPAGGAERTLSMAGAGRP